VSVQPPSYFVSAHSVHPLGMPPIVVLSLLEMGQRRRRGAPEPEPLQVPMTLGQAHELGAQLVAEVQAMLSGQKRPWDDDPGRVPFVSRRRGGGRQASAASADRHPPGPQTPGSRPTHPLDSAA
jgi:hypothetical protein